MIKNIKFNHNTQFLGRNGTFIQSGLSVSNAGGGASGVPVVILEPFTSKGLIGRAALEIPTEQVIEVIHALLEHVPSDKKLAMVESPNWVIDFLAGQNFAEPKPKKTVKPKMVRTHLFSPHTNRCIHCGISSTDDLIENRLCVPHRAAITRKGEHLTVIMPANKK